MSLAKGSRYYADPNFFAVIDQKTHLFLNQEMKDSFQRFGKMIFVVKFINADLDPAKA